MNLFLPSVANFKCTPFDRQMYPQGCMYPRLETPDIDHESNKMVLLYWMIEENMQFLTVTL